MSATPPTVQQALDAFLASLAGKSPRTRATYASALQRLCEFMAGDGLDPAATATQRLSLDLAEDYYAWLVARYGRERRATISTYLAALRAFFRYLDRRGWVAPIGSMVDSARRMC